jgi:hypothetical protein
MAPTPTPTPTRAERQASDEAFVARLPRPGTYAKFKPAIGTHLVVQLPGETLRCPVQTVIDADTVIVKINVVPMAKSHTFRFGETVGVRRRVRNGHDVWEAQTDREFLAEQKRAAPPKPAPQATPKVAAKATLKPAPKRPAATKRGAKAKRSR